MRRAALLLVLALAACTRPLAEGEVRFAEALYGDALDVEEVRVAQGIGAVPPARSARPFEVDLDGFSCDRGGEPTPVKGPPAAFVVRNRIHLNGDFYAADTLLGWPETSRPIQSILMAHELAHVWQWQNRDVSGYAPLRAASESLRAADPYFYRSTRDRDFGSFGFEQQAALIEDYVCYTLLEPSAPRRSELRAVIAPVLPLDRFDAEAARLR